MAGSGGRSPQGATITFGTTGFTANIHFIDGTEEDRGEIETTHLGLAVNSKATYVPGDIVHHEPVPVRYEYNPSFSTFPPLTNDPETITITYPLRTGQSVAATTAGSAFVKKRKSASLEKGGDQLMMGELEIRWNGLTGPTHTAGS